MHILIVNDDGPPSSKSPYVHSLVRSLEAAGHTVSVVLPDVQRSWIGKAHLINEVIRCIPSQVPDQSGWLLVSSTPAACVHVGLHHSPLNRGPVDLVISGPNFGFNASSLFALSSGTLGAAFEATLCRKRAIALSYNQLASPCPEALDATTRQSVRIIEALMQQWPKDDQSLLYSVNMSVSTDFSRQKIIWTGLHQNFWERMGAFKAVEACPASGDDSSPLPPVGTFDLEWGPDLDYSSQSSPGLLFKEDVGVLERGDVSVTAFRASFAAAAAESHGKEFII